MSPLGRYVCYVETNQLTKHQVASPTAAGVATSVSVKTHEDPGPDRQRRDASPTAAGAADLTEILRSSEGAPVPLDWSTYIS